MTKLNSKEISKMSKLDRERKVQELKLELLKSRTSGSKTGGSSKTKQIKKMIAKILTMREEKS